MTQGYTMITANFAINQYSVTASNVANGTISPAGVTNINYGGSQFYTITPATNYHTTRGK